MFLFEIDFLLSTQAGLICILKIFSVSGQIGVLNHCVIDQGEHALFTALCLALLSDSLNWPFARHASVGTRSPPGERRHESKSMRYSLQKTSMTAT